MEEKEEEKKKNNTGLIVIIVVLVLIVLLLVGYICINKLNNNKNNNQDNTSTNVEGKDNDKEKVKLKTVELSDDEFQKLIGIIPMEGDTPITNDIYTPFDNKKLTISDMSTRWMYAKASQKVTSKGECTQELFQLNGLCDFTLKRDDVNAMVKKLYGDINVEAPAKIDGEFLWHCTLKDDTYSCSNSGGGYAVSEPGSYFSKNLIIKLEEAKKDDNNLYVYIKYARIKYEKNDYYDVKNANDIKFKLLKYGTSDELIDGTNELIGSDFYEYPVKTTLVDKLYNEYKDKLTNYKITYKINGSDYTLVSIEPTK